MSPVSQAGARYVSDGETFVYRARWPRQDASAHEAWSEAQTSDGRSTMFKLVMKRAD